MQVFLDANVAMYAAGQEHPYKAPCARVMEEVAEGRLDAAIDTEIIQEILYRYGALQRWDIGTSLARSLLRLIPRIYPVQRQDMEQVVDLFRTHGPAGITARDLLHAAIMAHCGISHIISADRHFDKIGTVHRIDPLDFRP